jgi:hypothetical protein
MSPPCQPFSPLTYGSPHLVLDLPLSLLNMMDTAVGQGEACNALARTRPRQPVTPERAQTRSRARQSTSPPHRLRPPFDFRFCPEHHHATSSIPDMLARTGEPCRCRPRRRLPPRYCQLASRSPPRQTTIFRAMTLVIIAVTP